MPLVDELSMFIPGKRIVEDRELGTGHPVEVFDFNVANEERDEELVMEDKILQPLILFESSQSSNTRDCANVEEEENDSSS